MSAINQQVHRLHPLDWVFLLLIPAVLLLTHLAGAPLFDVDEGAFSEATREMFERGDFLSTWLNGEPRFDKPILIYWLQALFVWLLGVHEWSFRLPSALAAVVWAAATGHFVLTRWGQQAGRLAALMVATCLGVFVIGRAATADSLLNCLLALTMFDAWRFIESQRRAPLNRMYLWIGLGILTKGPIAVLIPVAVTFLYCLSQRNVRLWWKAVWHPVGWLILVAIAAPWYVWILLEHGQDFIDGFIMKHNVGRFSSPMEGHAGSFVYYTIIVPFLLMPWLSPLFKALGNVLPDWGNKPTRFLWLWCGFVLVFFSFSGTKLPHYALYGCTPLFVLMAIHAGKIKWGVLACLPMVLWLAVLAALPALLQWASRAGKIDDGFYALQIAEIGTQNLNHMLMFGGAVCVVALVVSLLKSLPATNRLSVLALFHTLMMTWLIAPLLGGLAQQPIKNAGLWAKDQPLTIAQDGVHWPSFSVYRQAQTPHIRLFSDPKHGKMEAILTRTDRFDANQAQTILFQQAGVTIYRPKPSDQHHHE